MVIQFALTFVILYSCECLCTCIDFSGVCLATVQVYAPLNAPFQISGLEYVSMLNAGISFMYTIFGQVLF